MVWLPPTFQNWKQPLFIIAIQKGKKYETWPWWKPLVQWPNLPAATSTKLGWELYSLFQQSFWPVTTISSMIREIYLYVNVNESVRRELNFRLRSKDEFVCTESCKQSNNVSCLVQEARRSKTDVFIRLFVSKALLLL